MLQKYTFCDGKKSFVMCKGALDASQKLPAIGGRFVYWDISDAIWKACADNAVAIGGWVEQSTDSLPAGTGATKATSTTKGADKFAIIDVEDRIVELPYAASGASATLTEAVGAGLIGKKIDLYVDANGVQYADNATNQAILQVKGYDVSRNTLKVEVIPAYIVQVA